MSDDEDIAALIVDDGDTYAQVNEQNIVTAVRKFFMSPHDDSWKPCNDFQEVGKEFSPR